MRGVKLYSVDVVGEVLKEDQLFETYRYRFDYPYESASDPIAVVIDRFLRPAEYKSRIKLSDLNSSSEALIEKMIVVPDIGSGSSAVAADNIESNQTKLRIVPLPDELLAGPQHIDTITSGDDIKAVESLLLGSPNFLWITRGTPIWGHDAALKRFTALYDGTWRLDPETSGLKITMVSEGVAQIYVPIIFTIGAAGQAAQQTKFLMNQVLIKTSDGWRVSSILPIPAPPQ